MKVLSKEKWSKEIKCRSCKAKLEIEEADLFAVNTAMGYAGETWDPRLRVTCAVCHTDIDVTNKVPRGMQNKKYDEIRKNHV
jgi:hypothetical protein